MKRTPIFIFPLFLFSLLLFVRCAKPEVIPNLFVTKVYSASVPLNAVCFTDANHGYVGGNDGTILQTFDGGNSWTPVNVGSNVDAQFNCVSFPSKDTGWISGYENQSGIIRQSALFSTFDGGLNWQHRGAPSGMIYSYFPTKNVGYHDDGTTIERTINGGSSWNILGSSPYPDINYTNLFFVNSDTGFVGTGFGESMTRNGGLSWSGIQMPSGEPSSIDFADNLHGVAVFYSGNVDRTSDGGMTWENSFYAPSNDGYPLNCVCMPTTDVALAGGIDYLFVSVDGGISWKQYYQQDGSSFPGEISGISFYDSYNGYAVTREGAIYRLKRADEIQ
jgi:photosystem II stability/assembly factor-like uncharacterized protein